MAQLPLNKVMEYIRRVAGAPGGGDGTDGQLLERFVEQHDETAFSAMVQRHGPLVLGLCRRVLRDAHHAEDAFQATFLVLARKAGSIASHELLAHWLYSVAYRVAVRARVRVGKLQAREKPLEDREVQTVGINSSVHEDPAWGELGPVLDAEVNRLSRKYRQAVVLCCLEGKTQEEAARLLRCPPGTVKSRLSRARELLQKRLLRRGVAPTAGVLAAALAPGAGSAAVPAALVNATIKAATLFAAGKAAAAAGISAHIVTLAEGALQAMFMTKIKIVAVVLLSLGLAGGATGVAMHRVLAEKEGPAKPALAQNDPAKPKAEKPPANGKEPPAKEVVRPKEVRLMGIGKDQQLSALFFSPDAKLVAGVNGESGLRLWDAITGKELHTLEVDVGKGGKQFPWPAAFSPDGKLLAAWSRSMVTIWQTATGKEIARIPGSFMNPNCLCFTPDGKSLVTVGYSDSDSKRAIQFWDFASGKELFRISNKEQIGSIALSPDGKLLAGTYQVWDNPPPGSKRPSFFKFSVLVVWEVGSDSGKEVSRVNEALEVRFAVFSPDGKPVCCGRGEQGHVYSPNGKFLGSVGYTDVTLCEADPYKLLGSFQPYGPKEGHMAAIFLADNKTFLTAGDNGVIKRWDLSDLPRNLPAQKKK